MARRHCSNCYFNESCGVDRYGCSFFSPIEEVEWSESQEERYIERERIDFHRRFWNIYMEEDRLQDLFG